MHNFELTAYRTHTALNANLCMVTRAKQKKNPTFRKTKTKTAILNIFWPGAKQKQEESWWKKKYKRDFCFRQAFRIVALAFIYLNGLFFLARICVNVYAYECVWCKKSWYRKVLHFSSHWMNWTNVSTTSCWTYGAFLRVFQALLYAQNWNKDWCFWWANS